MAVVAKISERESSVMTDETSQYLCRLGARWTEQLKKLAKAAPDSEPMEKR